MTYGTLFRQPGARSLVAAGLPGRLPIAAYGVGLLALGKQAYGSLAVGGALAAAYTVATIATGPVTGSLQSRGWYRRALVWLTLGSAAVMVVLLRAAEAHVAPVVVGVLAGLVGLLLPPAGVIARARWSARLSATDVGPALFLESALDEAVFILGPTLITAVGAMWGADSALLIAAFIATAGCLGLAFAQRVPASGDRPADDSGLQWRPLLHLAAVIVIVGWVFSSIQVAVFAATAESGVAWAAGPVLLVFSLVSLAAGLGAGLLAPARSPERRHWTMVGLLAFGLTPALAATGPASLTVLLLPAAVAASPAVATGFARAGRLGGRPGEAAAWCAAALGAGLALGSLGGGAAADAAGSRLVLLIAIAVGAVGWLAARPSIPALNGVRC